MDARENGEERDIPMFNLPQGANYETLAGGRRVTGDSDEIEIDERDLLRGGSAHTTLAKHWAHFFSRGNDFEAARANHVFTPEERRKITAFESIDYLPPNSKCFRTWLRDQVHRRQWDRWLMMFCIGVSVGLVGYCMYSMIEALSHFKYGVARWVLMKYNVYLSWVFSVTVSCILVFFATALVVYVAPAAGGSGVPECMAYLNGVAVPKIFDLYTFIVKFLSCAAALGAGMPIGPEGPMIHIGAIVGAGLSQGESTTIGCQTNLFWRFRNSRDKRDFVTAGVAAGVAVAFSAPIGGLLFAFEEIASYWTVNLSWQIFFSCMSGFLGISILRSAQTAVLKRGLFGLLDSITFEVQAQITSHAVSLLPAVVIGIVCGGLAILFTVFNLKVARLRQAIAPTEKPVRRMLEPLTIMFVYATLTTFLPLAFKCVPTGCFVDEVTEEITCPKGTSANIRRIVETGVQLYTCQENKSITEFPESIDDLGPESYNELATLMSVTGEEAIKHLFTRRTHLEFGWGSVTTMLVVYFTLAAIAAGSALSAGLFVPMLVIGACAGRLVGIAATHFIMEHDYPLPTSTEGFTPDSPWTWIDPGAFALVGAGAFMGGVTRLTISLSVIMMEISNDIRLLPSVLVSILVAKAMADMCTHALYHALLEIKCVPFLPGEPNASVSPDLLHVTSVMRSPVVCIKEVDRVQYIKTVLRDTGHSVFPVVRSTNNGQVFVGTIARDHLKVILRRLATLPIGAALDVTYEDLQMRQVSQADRDYVADQEMALLHDIPVAAVDPEADGGSQVRQRLANGHAGRTAADEGVVDLRPYMNTSAPSVLDTFSVERAYMMFRTLGLRHLVVVDAVNHIVGIISRQDLLGYCLDDAISKAQRKGEL
uniref:Chloride channel protein n=3 Tax=Tetraselmis sp. GSL018 TaxID=582737 RepID=A0A061RFD9_9CHLO